MVTLWLGQRSTPSPGHLTPALLVSDYTDYTYFLPRIPKKGNSFLSTEILVLIYGLTKNLTSSETCSLTIPPRRVLLFQSIALEYQSITLIRCLPKLFLLCLILNIHFSYWNVSSSEVRIISYTSFCPHQPLPWALHTEWLLDKYFVDPQKYYSWNWPQRRSRSDFLLIVKNLDQLQVP